MAAMTATMLASCSMAWQFTTAPRKPSSPLLGRPVTNAVTGRVVVRQPWSQGSHINLSWGHKSIEANPAQQEVHINQSPRNTQPVKQDFSPTPLPLHCSQDSSSFPYPSSLPSPATSCEAAGVALAQPFDSSAAQMVWALDEQIFQCCLIASNMRSKHWTKRPFHWCLFRCLFGLFLVGLRGRHGLHSRLAFRSLKGLFHGLFLQNLYPLRFCVLTTASLICLVTALNHQTAKAGSHSVKMPCSSFHYLLLLLCLIELRHPFSVLKYTKHSPKTKAAKNNPKLMPNSLNII